MHVSVLNSAISIYCDTFDKFIGILYVKKASLKKKQMSLTMK